MTDNSQNNTLKGFLLSYEGRVNRKNYWLWVLCYIIVYIIAIVIDVMTGMMSADGGIGVFTGILTLVFLWPGVVIAIKRLHDRDMVGWWFLLVFVPIGNLVLFVIVLFLAGTAGDNRYGPPPDDHKPFGI